MIPLMVIIVVRLWRKKSVPGKVNNSYNKHNNKQKWQHAKLVDEIVPSIFLSGT